MPMASSFLLIALLFVTSFAVDYQVSVEENTFSPNNISTLLNVGDRITFTFLTLNNSSNPNNLYIFEGTAANCTPSSILGCAPEPVDGVCSLASLGENRAITPYVFNITANLAGKSLVYASLPNCSTMFGTAVVAGADSNHTCNTTSGCDNITLPFCLNPGTPNAICIEGCTEDEDCLPYVGTPLCSSSLNGTFGVGQCVAGNTGVCNTTSGCDLPTLPFCLNPGTPVASCVEGCTDDADCAPYVGTPICSSSLNGTLGVGQCVAGNNNATCNTTSGCDNPTLPFCLNPGTPQASCVEGCTEDADCVPYTGTPICYFSTPNGTFGVGKCIAENNTVPCNVGTGCNNPSLPFCLNPGTPEAVCVAGCTVDADCTLYPGTPVCSTTISNVTVGQCVPSNSNTSACTTTSGCLSPLSPFCLYPGTSMAFCVSGCRNNEDCIPYEGTPICFIPEGETAGSCISEIACTTTSGCGATLSFCLNPGTTEAVCVSGCTSDSDCVPYEGTPICLIQPTATYGTCTAAQIATCTITSGCNNPDLPFCRNPGQENAVCVAGCVNNTDCVPYSTTPICSTSGSCVSQNNCSSTQYSSNGDCVECPQSDGSYNCATRKCTGPNDVTCATCPPGYTLTATGSCSGPTGLTCDLCPTVGEVINPCPDSAPICCGCGVTGGVCVSSCLASCGSLINCTSPQCPTPLNCQNKGTCDVVPAGTCLQCNPGYELVPDPKTSLGLYCKPVIYQSCNLCDSDPDSVCSALSTCCCGTCRAICNIECTQLDCDETPEIQDITILVIHMIQNTTCDSVELVIFINFIDAVIRFQLGSWSGNFSTSHQCSTSGKRQAGDVYIDTTVTLSGPDAEAQGQQLANNMPQTATANGVTIILISVEQEDNGLSDGDIAGIVIGSVFGALLIAIILFLLYLRLGSPRTA